MEELSLAKQLLDMGIKSGPAVAVLLTWVYFARKDLKEERKDHKATRAELSTAYKEFAGGFKAFGDQLDRIERHQGAG